MADITVEKLAKMVGIPARELLVRMKDAGIEVKAADQTITDKQKHLLLDYLKSSHVTKSEKPPTLKLKKPSSATSAAPASNVISVKVRKRRTHYDVDKALVAEEEKVKQAADGSTAKSKTTGKTKEKASEAPEKKEKITRGQVTAVKPKKRITDAKQKKSSKSAKTKEAESVEEDATEQPVVEREISIPETLTVAELAQKMAIKVAEVIKAMMNMGAMATINQVIDQDTAALVAEEMGFKTKMIKETVLEDNLTLS